MPLLQFALEVIPLFELCASRLLLLGHSKYVRRAKGADYGYRKQRHKYPAHSDFLHCLG
jgi:hypothetical protein